MIDYGLGLNDLLSLNLIGETGIICLILAIIGAFVLLLAFLPKWKESRYKGSTLRIYKVLNFRETFGLSLLKLLYLISLIYTSLMGLVILFSFNFFFGLISIVVSNLFLRVVYEVFILIFSIHDNLSQINQNTAQIAANTKNDNIQGQFQSQTVESSQNSINPDKPPVD
jgi:hypothetical protein